MSKEKTTEVFVRFGFGDQVYTMKQALSPDTEICSCDSFVTGYEDKNGRECHDTGEYLDQPIPDPNQLDMFND